MKKETRTVVYDDELRMEAYRFEGIVQPFSSHFHEHYVIGFPLWGQFWQLRGFSFLNIMGKEVTIVYKSDPSVKK